MGPLSVEDRIRALEDRNAVIELAATYNRAVDSYDEALWLSVWHDDAEYLIGETFGNHYGLEQIRTILHTLREYFHEMHHYATNVVVRLDGDSARMLVDADVTATDRSGRALMLAASYVDTCERRRGRWGFTKREISLHYATPVTQPWTLTPDERFVLDA
ncbi:nuclear transport factor 2 family protein [Sporichthya polymorpha]|uniref:nuclear transport factor 2 family protein n=1 Tax=Sporichthya polymorpha TaxID=35751 RepID=UPI00037200C1|nr:nuclear transport factor 2 family protein [Sporichthya polymorpha]